MIFVNRNEVAAPTELLAFHIEEMARLKPLFDTPSDKQVRVSVDVFRSKNLRDVAMKALDQLFHGKCAFCERRGALIEHFRPKWRAARGNRHIDTDHYWWLASDWNNLYLCCRECSMRKANLFPIDGSAAAPFTSGRALDAEKPMLIDPCNDDPALHLRFESSGVVLPLSPNGKGTIEVFELNNSALVEKRREVAVATTFLCEFEWTSSSGATDKNTFANAVLLHPASRSAHIAVARAVVDDFFEARTVLAKAPDMGAPPPPSWAEPDSVKGLSTVWLQRIEICNFKAITYLDLSFPPLVESDDNVSQPWLMFLGENGAGKTSILQAVALTLMPDDEREARGGPKRWLTKPFKEGYVRLTFTDSSIRKLSFEEGNNAFTVSGRVPQMPLLAYGATRLLPDRDKDDARTSTPISVRNLFDPTFPLIDAERKLCDEKAISNERFAMLAADLRQLLPPGANAPINRTKTALNSEINERVIPLHDLSGGYKSVLALAMDIMVHLTNSSFDMQSAQGLVMIDELELHLHPRWKIRIVEQLRGLFPRVRFISCTHDPLCVHGLRSGELHIIGLNPTSKDLIVEQFDVPPGTSADAILTGPWFGMQSTIDAGTIELMADHSALLQLEKRTEEQQRSLELLYLELCKRIGTFGDQRDARAVFARSACQAAYAKPLSGPSSDAKADPNIWERFDVILQSTGDTGREDGFA